MSPSHPHPYPSNHRAGRTVSLLPEACLLCAGRARPGDALCPGCARDLEWLGGACRRCASPLPAGTCCARCLASPPPYASALAALRYRGSARYLLTRFKFHADLAAGRALAAALCTRVRGSAPRLLVPVPLHVSRLRQRGFDQALELARVLHRELALPLAADGLRRRRATAAQSGLVDAAARRRNLRGAFECSPRRCWDGAALALVDDVLTSGATAAEAARTLLLAGAGSVEVWACCRAPGPAASAALKRPGSPPPGRCSR